MSPIKEFKNTKYKGLFFDGLRVESCFNIHSLHQEHEIIPEVSEFGTFTYVKSILSFVLVKNKLIANGTQSFPPMKHNELLMIIDVPIYLPLLNNKLNVLSGNFDLSYDEDKLSNNEIIKENEKLLFNFGLTQNTDESQFKRRKLLLDSIRQKLEEFSFVFIEGRSVKLLQWDALNATFNTPNLNSLDSKKLESIVNEKLDSLSKEVDLIKVLFNSLLSKEAIELLFKIDYSQCPIIDNVDTFLQIFSGNENLVSQKYQLTTNETQFKEMVHKRFTSCVRKQFDFSWVMNKVNSEMNKHANKEKYKNEKKHLDSEFQDFYKDMLTKLSDGDSNANGIGEQDKSTNDSTPEGGRFVDKDN